MKPIAPLCLVNMLEEFKIFLKLGSFLVHSLKTKKIPTNQKVCDDRTSLELSTKSG